MPRTGFLDRRWDYRKDITITWTCASCGYVNTCATALRCERVSESESAARRSAREELRREKQFLLTRHQSAWEYQRLCLQCACGKCGHREPWVCTNPKSVSLTFYLSFWFRFLAIVWAVLLFVFFIVPKVPLGVRLTVMLVYGGVLGAWYLCDRWIWHRRDLALAALPDSAFPILVREEEAQDSPNARCP